MRYRRISAHATGIGACVTIEESLVILGQRKRHGPRAIEKNMVAHLFTDQTLLENNARARCAETTIGKDFIECGERFGNILRDKNAFATRETIRLDHPGLR